jgi:hypothetical protein
VATLAKQFAVVFFLGFIIFVAALGLGGMADGPLSANVNLVGLRYLGVGMMAGGLALWIAKRRGEGGKTGLNTLIGWLVILSIVALLAGAIWAQALAVMVGPIGVGAAVAALIIGFIATLIMPAGPKPLVAHWPEGGEPVPAGHEAEGHDEPASSHDAGAEHAH